MGTIREDLHRSVRALLGKPQFGVVAVLTLALGLGANTAIFSVMYGVLLRPLPVTDEDRIVVAWKRDPAANNPLVELSVAEFRDWQAQSQSFESWPRCPRPSSATASCSPDGAKRSSSRAPAVSGPFFGLLGARPALGRVIQESDDRPGAARVVVLSDRTWRERFGADPDIVNKSITLTDTARTVVGVMPPGFQFPSGADVWMPLTAGMSPTMLQNRTAGWLQMVGKLRPGVTAQQAESELNVIIGGLQARHPTAGGQVQRAVVTPLRQYIFGDVSLALKLLFAATSLLLLIACANVANLVLARAADRRKQFAIQAALGAGRGAIVRQLLTESLVLALVGGVLGVGLAVVDPNQAVTDVSTMLDQVARQLAGPRFIAVLLNWLSILAVLLASIGIYGVMVQSVVQRRTEIGTRIALGAQAWDILRLVTRAGLAAGGGRCGPPGWWGPSCSRGSSVACSTGSTRTTRSPSWAS